MRKIAGRITRVGDSVSGDVILPARYAFAPPKEMAEHVLERWSPDLPRKVATSQILLAGKNFGCGSARESAAIALKAAGLRAIVATSFARLFFRNAINQGLFLVECPAAAGSDALGDGDELVIDLERQEVRFGDQRHGFLAPPQIILEIVEAGGLVNYGRRLVHSEGGSAPLPNLPRGCAGKAGARTSQSQAP